ncbi:MAG TPA: ABC transporter ATP-binding protein [Acetobacteraceae bacterium]|nr:ABC transporter ATP-binding protein [Acetobacteraceae bacterium]
MAESILQARDLSRHFGGLAALSEVSLACEMGQVHAVIGPNGAGKSTLVNLLSGELAASAGQVLFEGRDITGLAADRISQLGVARSYQKTNLFRQFTAFENCRLAAQSRLRTSMHFFRPALTREDINAEAHRALAQAGLADRHDVVVSALSHGEQRQVEIAMALATRPRMLLLDEPLAGMGAEESARIVALLHELARDHAILLVEHDMDAVFAVANTLTVMVNGRVLESGSPARIRASRAVQEAYLGADSD